MLKNGYLDNLVKEQMERALRRTPNNKNNSEKVNGVLLVVT